MNTEKIIKRIQQIFKDGYYFTKKDLLDRINIIKVYPLIQIDAALQSLVSDKTEYITDRYGRLGNLVNIGQYYLFQPVELSQENISFYDRSVPLEYKRREIEIDLLKMQPKQVKKLENIKIMEKEEEEIEEGDKLKEIDPKIDPKTEPKA